MLPLIDENARLSSKRSSQPSAVPNGTCRSGGDENPAMNRWAKLGCTAGEAERG